MEVIFSLDGIGLLGFESLINRDYPVIFGTLYVFTLIGLLLNLLGDLMYVAIDPRIDFERAGTRRDIHALGSDQPLTPAAQLSKPIGAGT